MGLLKILGIGKYLKKVKDYTDQRIENLIGEAPETLDTLGELAAALQANDEVVQVLNDAIVTKADKTYVDEAIANIPTESDIVIVDCPDGSVISHNFEQIMTAVNDGKMVYTSIYGTIMAPLSYIADDDSFVEFNAIREDNNTIWLDGLVVNSDNSFSVKHMNLMNSMGISEEDIDDLSSLLM